MNAKSEIERLYIENEFIKNENNRLHSYITQLLNKVCSNNIKTDINDTITQQLGATILKNLGTIDIQKTKDIFEMKAPSHQSILHLNEIALFGEYTINTLILLDHKGCKYLDENNTLILCSLDTIIVRVCDFIYNFFQPSIEEFTNKSLEDLYAAQSFEEKNCINMKDNNRVENLHMLKSTRIHQKINKDFINLIKKRFI